MGIVAACTLILLQRGMHKLPRSLFLKGVVAFYAQVAARTWLQASNPSERWKWDFMYQDLPPVKGSVDLSAVPSIGLIPLREVK